MLACIAVAPSRDFALKWLDVLDASLPIADSLIRSRRTRLTNRHPRTREASLALPHKNHLTQFKNDINKKKKIQRVGTLGTAQKSMNMHTNNKPEFSLIRNCKIISETRFFEHNHICSSQRTQECVVVTVGLWGSRSLFSSRKLLRGACCKWAVLAPM